MTNFFYCFDESPGLRGAGSTSRPVRFIKTIFERSIFKKYILLIVWSLVIGGLSACSTHLPPAGIEAYNQCKYKKAVDTFSKTKKNEKDALLFDLAILSSAVHAGDTEEVKRVGLSAQQQMWNYEGAGKGTASLISSEAIRIYKGEPFEKAMASMYLGSVYFNEGDYENAKAAFTKAMFAVQTKGENSEADFAAPLVLLAKTYLKLNDSENANIVLKRLEKILPKNQRITLEKIAQIKTIAFVELGKVATKVRTGPGDSLIAWQRQPYNEKDATLLVDGKSDGQVRTMDDLKYQAESVDRGAKTTIQATKGVLREASAATAVIAANEAAKNKNETAGWVALGTGLFALANQSQADVRQWELLPDLLLLILSTEPTTEGKHSYEVSFLPSQSQVWYDERKANLDQIYIVRANSCSKNKKSKGNGS